MRPKNLRPSLCCIVLYTFPDGRKLIFDSEYCLKVEFDGPSTAREIRWRPHTEQCEGVHSKPSRWHTHRIFSHVQDMSEQITHAQVYRWWRALNENTWLRASDQIASAKMLMGEHTENIAIITSLGSSCLDSFDKSWTQLRAEIQVHHNSRGKIPKPYPVACWI